MLGEFNYGNPKYGKGYEYCNFLPGLRNLGHEVLFLDNQSRSLYRDFSQLNETLLKRVEEEHPDIVFVVQQQYEIWLETWSILKNAGLATTINWTTDDSWKYSQFSRFLAPYFHAFTTTYPDVLSRYSQDGHTNVILTQWAANSEHLLPPIPGKNCKYAVSFVGIAHGDRKKWIRELKKRGINVECFGYGWPNGPIPSSNIPNLMQDSVICLNFANAGETLNGYFRKRVRQIKARTFEVPGSGGFLLSEWTEGLDQYYSVGNEIAIFTNLDELAQQINFYLSHLNKRDEIAWCGHERTRNEHIYENRFSVILPFAQNKYTQWFNDNQHTVNRGIDWQKFQNASASYSPNKKILAFKDSLVRMCNFFWGKERGWRVARRIVFESSWRFSGIYTYSSSGWPGRMFYKEN